MPATKTFHYNSIDATGGKRTKGTIEATNEAAAAQHAARSSGVVPLSI